MTFREISLQKELERCKPRDNEIDSEATVEI